MCRSMGAAVGANTRRCQEDGQASHVMTGRIWCQHSMQPWQPRGSQRCWQSHTVSSVWHSRQQPLKLDHWAYVA